MARGHHHREEHGGKPEEHPHHGHPMHEMHRADGGRTEKEDGKPKSYTAEGSKEEEEEAEGKEANRGGRMKRGRHADGGAAAPAALANGGTAAPAFARGGRTKHVEGEGHKTKHRRMDRPGRKRGGGVGADMTPLSTAARTHQTGHMADADELAE